MVDPTKLAALGRLARDRIDEVVTPEHDAAEQARFAARLLAEPARARARARVALAFGLAAALAVAIVMLWPSDRLRYAVEGAAVAESGYVSAPPDSVADVRFTDGSSARLTAGSSMRVVEVTPHGARLLLEEGRAEVSIAKQPGARWSVEAGPYAIAVTGTRFVVAWSRGDETLRVVMQEGAVAMRGPLLQDGLSMRAGQVLVANVRAGRVQLEEDPPRFEPPSGGASAGPEPAATPSNPPPSGSEEVPVDRPKPSADAPLPSWSKRVAEGDFASVLAEADQLGIDSVLGQGSLDNLVALADAARYGKRGDLARRALTAMRARFPGSGPAKSAAFLLGRMTDDGGSPGAAIAWYDAYLSESPGGTFAVEALGRRMRAVSRARGKAAARPLAEDYVRRHPAGPHAAIAREILGP